MLPVGLEKRGNSRIAVALVFLSVLRSSRGARTPFAKTERRAGAGYTVNPLRTGRRAEGRG